MKDSCWQKILVLVFLVFIFLISQNKFAYCKEARGVTKDSIKIGVIVDLVGPTSNVGVVMVEAYKNLTRHINDEGGIHGRKIKLIIENDRYSIPAGIAAFKKLLYKDKVLSILGPVSVGETKVLFRHVAKNKIPMLPWAPDKSIMDPYRRYIFPTNGFYDNELGVIYNHLMNELKPVNPKVALCYPDVESGKILRKSAEDWANHFGLKLHMEIVPLSAIDVTSQVLSMKRAGTTHVLIHHVAPGAAAVLKDMKKFGLDIPLFGTSAACTEDVIRIGGEASEKFVGASPYSSWYEDIPGMAKVREISLTYNPDAEKSYRIKSYSMGWVIPLILYEGLKRAGKDVNGEKLVAALETIKDLDTEGICGFITYTPTMHYGLNYSKLFKADPKSDRLVAMTDWRLPPERK
ncbi:MAG: ABC transporter substrate-binding protein [Thermodesulfobacteriota bacterium]|nr:ABC transporter substrate-binding protein [Thermodesulfobacteriota bacterium]